MKRNEFFLSQYGWKFGKKMLWFFFLNKRCNFLNNKQSPNEFSCGCKFYLVWLWRRVCRLEKFSSIDFLRNFDGKIEVFHVPLIIFFFWKKISLSFLEKKIILFQVQRFFSWIFLGANVMRNFDGKIHTACFVIILISISTFFCFLSGDQICFLHYSFFLICVRPGVWATKKITTHFFLLHIFN